MILQRHPEVVRVIAQHHHAQLSGQLAGSWRGFEEEPEVLSLEVVLAIAQHDWAWLEMDASWSHAPPFDAERGAPHDFLTLPLTERLALYSQGMERAASVHPYIGWLTSRHYASFIPERVAPEFARVERARQAELRRELEAFDDATLERALVILQHLDVLSLVVCMAPPGAVDLPPWLKPEMRVGGVMVRSRWSQDGSTLHLEPFPFAAPVELAIESRELPRQRWASVEALAAAYTTAERRVDRVRVMG